MSTINWFVPWQPIANPSQAEGLLRELSSELRDRHLLHGIQARAVAIRQDNDDVLFELLDGSARFAVVHLTWAQHPEPNPLYPGTEIYSDWSDFEQERMQPDAAAWTM